MATQHPEYFREPILTLSQFHFEHQIGRSAEQGSDPRIRRLVAKGDREATHDNLKEVMQARTEMGAVFEVGRFKARWEERYPKAVKCLRDDLDQLVTRRRYMSEDERRADRTTNHIERNFVDLRRRTRPMGVFQNKASMECILFAVFMECSRGRKQGLSSA